MLRLVFHLLIALNYYASIFYDLHYVNLKQFAPQKDIKFMKGRLKFLTYWNLLLQSMFFTICVINDIVGTNENSIGKKPFIRNLKEWILTCLAFPLSMFVGLTFWGLYAVDRELVFPKVLDQFFPTWLNHVMHTNIMVFVLIEMIISFRSYPKRKTGLGILLVFMISYLVWIHVIFNYSGMWVYPILDVLNLPFRIVFFAVLLGLSVSLYLMGERLNKIIWSDKIKEVEKKHKVK